MSKFLATIVVVFALVVSAHGQIVKPDLSAPKQLAPISLDELGTSSPAQLDLVPRYNQLEPIKKEFPQKFDTSFWIALTSFSAASIADIVTTNSAIKRGGREGNPLFAENGGRSVRMGWNVALTGGIIALASWAEHKGHRKAARFILFFAAGTRTAAAINNHLVAR